MSTFEILMLFWALPALCTCLLFMGLTRMNGNRLEDFDKSSSGYLVLFSSLYPVGLLLLLICEVAPQLAKERQLRKPKND